MDKITKPCQKPGKKPRAVYSIYAQQHIDQIARKAQAFEENASLPDLLFRRQAKCGDPFLNRSIIQMHHTDSSVSDADGADKVQQEAQAKAFCDHFNGKHIRFPRICYFIFSPEL